MLGQSNLQVEEKYRHNRYLLKALLVSETQIDSKSKLTLKGTSIKKVTSETWVHNEQRNKLDIENW
jgi:hypothetical protein